MPLLKTLATASAPRPLVSIPLSALQAPIPSEPTAHPKLPPKPPLHLVVPSLISPGETQACKIAIDTIITDKDISPLLHILFQAPSPHIVDHLKKSVETSLDKKMASFILEVIQLTGEADPSLPEPPKVKARSASLDSTEKKPGSITRLRTRSQDLLFHRTSKPPVPAQYLPLPPAVPANVADTRQVLLYEVYRGLIQIYNQLAGTEKAKETLTQWDGEKLHLPFFLSLIKTLASHPTSYLYVGSPYILTGMGCILHNHLDLFKDLLTLLPKIAIIEGKVFEELPAPVPLPEPSGPPLSRSRSNSNSLHLPVFPEPATLSPHLPPELVHSHPFLLYSVYANSIRLYNQIAQCSTKDLRAFTSSYEGGVNLESFLKMMKDATSHPTPHLFFGSPYVLDGILSITNSYLTQLHGSAKLCDRLLGIADTLLHLLATINTLVMEKMNTMESKDADDKKSTDKEYMDHLKSLYMIDPASTPPQNKTLNALYSEVKSMFDLIDAKLQTFNPPTQELEAGKKYMQVMNDFKSGKHLEMSAAEMDLYAEGVAKLLAGDDKDPHFFTHLNMLFRREVDAATSLETLFRVDSFATKVIGALLRNEFDTFIKAHCTEFINQVNAENLEVNPKKLDLSTLDSLKQLSDRQHTLLERVHKFLTIVFEHIHQLDHTKKVLCTLGGAASDSFEDKDWPCPLDNILLTLFGGTVFLRGFNSKLIENLPKEDTTHRGLITISKIVQNVANGTSYTQSGKDSYMRFADLIPLDSFYISFMGRLRETWGVMQPEQEAPSLSKLSLIELLCDSPRFPAPTPARPSEHSTFHEAVTYLASHLCDTQDICFAFHSEELNPAFFASLIENIHTHAQDPKPFIEDNLFIYDMALHLVKTFTQWVEKNGFPTDFKDLEAINVTTREALKKLADHVDPTPKAVAQLLNVFTCTDSATSDAFLQPMYGLFSEGRQRLLPHVQQHFLAGLFNPEDYTTPLLANECADSIAALPKTPEFYAALTPLIQKEIEGTIEENALFRADSLLTKILSRIIASFLFTAIQKTEHNWKRLMGHINAPSHDDRGPLIEDFKSCIKATFTPPPEEFLNLTKSTQEAIRRMGGKTFPEKEALYINALLALFFVRGLSPIFTTNAQYLVYLGLHQDTPIQLKLASIIQTIQLQEGKLLVNQLFPPLLPPITTA
jgi:hypothetical protein